MKYPQTAILLFSKAAIAGKVKTRLLPVLSAVEAAELAAELQVQIIEKIQAASLAHLTVYAFPHCDPNLLVECRQQQGIDLGERMYNAATDALQIFEKILLIGSDCPVMQVRYLEQAIVGLQQHDAVIGPAEDGGYVLLGLKKASRALFEEIDWGSEQVLQQTYCKLTDLQWSWTELETLWDLDRPQDYECYQRLNSE